jgi:4-diphosphocytidyl-2-C-methyl-D-erythritol kinase
VRVTVPSFAKINWFLKICGRRSDGFHELRTLFQTLDLYDEISFELSSSGIELVTTGREVVGGDENLISRAARLMRDRARPSGGVRIHLKKRVPVGGGLGGGSSNAAVTLMVLNEIWKSALTVAELQELATELGSDVPFFLHGGLAFGWGRGERILPLSDRGVEIPVLLLYPRFQVSAAEAYSLLRAPPLQNQDVLTRGGLNTTIRRFRETVKTSKWASLENELEGPVSARYPVLAGWKLFLLDAGCDSVMLSGSGSTLFGVGSAGSLEAAAESCAKLEDIEALLCRTLSRKHYAERLARAGIQPLDTTPVDVE